VGALEATLAGTALAQSVCPPGSSPSLHSPHPTPPHPTPPHPYPPYHQASEGIDFADDNARAVVVLSIPYPNLKDTK
jgi:hypothetical protein